MAKVLMAMSGGVDSSVAAYLLKEQGYDVIGITLKLWDRAENTAFSKTCCSIDDVEDARSVAAKLEIPFYVLNFKKAFKESVINYFIDAYIKGLTPNPCIACNKFIKFDELMKRADKLGADYIATGHYAKIEYDNVSGEYQLKKSTDSSKDQTYVLYNLTQNQLKRTLLPLGGLNKQTVRDIALKLNLRVAGKPDSQEICFVEDNDYAKFIRENTKESIKPGNFIDKNGKILGVHKGTINYTIGQRKGLGVSFGKPVFVLSKNICDNTVTLGDEEDVFSKKLIAGDLNFISAENADKELKVKAKTRYSSQEADAVIYPQKDNTVMLTFNKPQRAITPGQSVVFYDGDVVIGGGIIQNSAKQSFV